MLRHAEPLRTFDALEVLLCWLVEEHGVALVEGVDLAPGWDLDVWMCEDEFTDALQAVNATMSVSVASCQFTKSVEKGTYVVESVAIDTVAHADDQV